MPTRRLLEYNPWWRSRDAIRDDARIRSWYESRLGRDPRGSHVFEAQDRIYSLRGPRQVGKTTLVKLMIEQNLETVPKWDVMYYSFEVKDRPGDIVDVIDEYLDYADHDEGGRRFIYLDEISGIKDWQKGIKQLADQGKLGDCTVVTTGSHAAYLRTAAERLPGRRGAPGGGPLDRILLPMKFREFVSAVDGETMGRIPKRYLPPPGGRRPALLGLLERVADKELSELWAFKNELDRCLDQYLLTGGMPGVVNEFLKDRIIDDSVYQMFVDSVLGDVRRMGKDDAHVKMLVPSIIKSMTNPTSWNLLGKDSDMPNHGAVREHVRLLSDMFVLLVAYRYDPAEGRIRSDSGKKVYFQDPFFMHALNGHASQGDSYGLSVDMLNDPAGRGALVEQAVADHCRRMAYEAAPSKTNFSDELSAPYWRGRKREVDFVVMTGAGRRRIPVEVKCQGRVRRDDMYGLFELERAAGMGGGIMVTRDKLGVEAGITMIPASMFLFLA